MKKYLIEGLADACPLCIDNGDGRAKEKRGPVFNVTCEGGGFAGPCCPAHLAALIRLDDTKPAAAAPKPEVKQDPRPEPRPQPAVATPATANVQK